MSAEREEMLATTIDMTMTMTMDPNVRCPVCLHEWCVGASFEYLEDSELECPECDSKLECSEVELERWWRWRAVNTTSEAKETR